MVGGQVSDTRERKTEGVFNSTSQGEGGPLNSPLFQTRDSEEDPLNFQEPRDAYTLQKD